MGRMGSGRGCKIPIALRGQNENWGTKKKLNKKNKKKMLLFFGGLGNNKQKQETLNPVYHVEQELRLWTLLSCCSNEAATCTDARGRVRSGGEKRTGSSLEPEGWSQTQGCRATRAMPDVEKVSVRVHLRAHGGGRGLGSAGEDW